MPPIPRDCTDRNRTSPFAFTGVKFEFRMPGASQSLAGPNYVLNTIVAESLAEIADALDGARSKAEITARASDLLRRYAREHKRIVFNGDNYNDAWVEEAAVRGLPNVTNAVDSLLAMTAEKNAAVLERHGVLSRDELIARQEILLEHYASTINIEALTMLQMAEREILPAALRYSAMLGEATRAVAEVGVGATAHKLALQRVCELAMKLGDNIEALREATGSAHALAEARERAVAYRDRVVPLMATLREAADALETVVDAREWPLPTYAEMLFLR